MTPGEFAASWKRERDSFLGEAYLADKISSLQLPPEKEAEIKKLLGVVLTDVFFSLLCGLDGSASIGDLQSPYTVRDEHGNLICDGDGSLESAAWEVFHGQSDESSAT